eukprot:Colp12_sorted_trinity150504_noHs@2957
MKMRVNSRWSVQRGITSALLGSCAVLLLILFAGHQQRLALATGCVEETIMIEVKTHTDDQVEPPVELLQETPIDIEPHEPQFLQSSLGCGKRFSDDLKDASETSSCPDLETLLSQASRSTVDAPLELVQQNCSLKWFTPDEACEAIENSGRKLIFIGDSFTRHFLQGMNILLTGDYEKGGLSYDLMKQEDIETCKCDQQFNEKTCRMNAVSRHFDDVGRPLMCKNWSRQWLVNLQWWNDNMWNQTELDRIVSDVDGNAVVQILNGLHLGLNVQRATDSYFTPAFNHVKNSSGKASLICASLPAPQWNKPAKYLASQAAPQVMRFNSAVQDVCKTGGAIYFDTFSTTTNATSFDGSHYTTSVNVLLAQLYLNLLRSKGLL